ncbi:hypothetical protein Tco_1175771 [Tanacetum coccineum]
MQKNVLKHQFGNFTTAPNESLDKAYDSQIALIMRNKADIDEIDIDDLYNNLRVYEDEMKRSSSSTSTSQNLAFLSSKNTSSTNEVSTANGDFKVSTAGGTSQVSSTLCAHEINGDDLEELDLRWQVAMLTIRVKKFIQRTGRNLNFKEKQPVTLDKRNAPTNKLSLQALVAQDGLGGYDWSNDFKLEPVNYALMAISSSSSSSSSDNEGYEIALESLESRILGHEMNELAWGEKYEFQNYKLKSSDEETTPANDRFLKAEGYHVVPPPITGNFLTPRDDISFTGLDEFAIRKKIIKSQTIELNTESSEPKTSEVNIEKSKSVMSKPNINTEKVIIED